MKFSVPWHAKKQSSQANEKRHRNEANWKSFEWLKELRRQVKGNSLEVPKKLDVYDEKLKKH